MIKPELNIYYIPSKRGKMAEDLGYYSETQNKYIEAPKKQLFRMQIPYSLRFGLIWTLFFAIIGIAIQSIKAGYFVFGDFFTTNYAAWFRSFGTFTDITIYPSGMDVLYAILGHWYYFFLTGGYLSVLWGIISLVIHWEVIFKKVEKQPEPEKPKALPAPIKPVVAEKAAEKPPIIIPARPITKQDLDEWLEEGYLFLADGQTRKSELIYNQLKRAYDPAKDSGQIMYKRILDFYYEILDEMKNPGFNKRKEDWYG